MVITTFGPILSQYQAKNAAPISDIQFAIDDRLFIAAELQPYISLNFGIITFSAVTGQAEPIQNRKIQKRIIPQPFASKSPEKSNFFASIAIPVNIAYFYNYSKCKIWVKVG